MLTIWIIHRDSNHRAAIARIAGAGDNAVLGGPLDRLFESATPPSVVVLGLGDDFEHELEFVHRFGPRLPGAEWVLLPSKADVGEAKRLFDTLPARYVTYPPSTVELRRALRDALRRRTTDPLSARHGRDALRDRFARWFADVDLPELMRAIDPRLVAVPVLVRGEAGTGRGVLARYTHAFGGGPDEAFVHVSCPGIRGAGELLAQIQSGVDESTTGPITVWLEDVDYLPAPAQRRLQDWIEFGLPDGALRGARVRWIGGAGDESELDVDPGLDPRLAEALAGVTLHIPPLRDRAEAVDAFVTETARAWSNERGERARRWSPDALAMLRAYPWPGNLHELEATVIRTLCFTSAETLLPVHLRFPGDSGWLDRLSEPHGRFERTDTPFPLHETDLPEATILPDEPADDEEDLLVGDEEVEEEVALGEEEEAILVSLGDPVDDDEDDGDPVEPMIAEPEPERAPASGSASPFAEPEPALPTAAPDAGAPSAIEMAEQAMSNVLPPATSGADTSPSDQSDLRQVVRALVHDLRNPLVSIRTFSELLPDHYDDDEFRSHFSELVSQDVTRIDEALARLQGMVDVPGIKSEPVDVAHLLEGLLDEHRDEIQSRRLLVLKELDHSVPHALGDPALLRDAFSGLLKGALAAVSDRGDIYLASRHHTGGQSGAPTLRVLLRYGTDPSASERPARGAQLDDVMAQTIVRSLGGTYTQDTTDADECVIVIDLPAGRPHG